MRKMSFILAIGLLFAMPASSAKPADQPFAGTWMLCSKYQGYDVCSYNVLAQKGARVCGLWGYWASGRDYQGRLTAIATGQAAKVEKICGRPGSDTSTECARKDTAPETWEQKTDRTLFICKGALYDSRYGEPGLCKGINKDLGTPKARSSAQSKVIIFPEDRTWLKACVEGTRG